MDEFEWLGIGNGEAIVRHREEGHVYRFKPGRDGGWGTLTLSRSDRGLASFSRPDDHAHAARP